MSNSSYDIASQNGPTGLHEGGVSFLIDRLEAALGNLGGSSGGGSPYKSPGGLMWRDGPLGTHTARHHGDMGGSTFPAMKVSLDYLPPILFLAYRFGVASLLMLLLFRSRILRRETLREGFLLGLTLFFGHGFQIVGLKYTTASNSAFITSLYVVFTPFIAYLLLGGETQAEGPSFARDSPNRPLSNLRGHFKLQPWRSAHGPLRHQLRLPDSPRPALRREGLPQPVLLADNVELRLFAGLCGPI